MCKEMSLNVIQKKVNSPVNGISEKDLIFLIEALTKEDRKKIADMFSEDLREFMSRTAIYKLSKRDTHLSNKNILKLMERNPEAKKFILELLRKRAEKILQLIEKLEADEE
ncbi:hypothetical protein [Saccharolobus sp.]|uniref:hypothetical protein n=2 Tax=Saccharolobus sp. TaxID=2100761 RepID=UPI003179F07D